MKEHRSASPLIDVRRPSDGSDADFNPPGFVWRPIEDATSYELEIAMPRGRSKRIYAVEGRCLWVSPDALERGLYAWRWRALGCGQDDTWSETFTFRVSEETAEMRIPSGKELVGRIEGRPRHMITEKRLNAFRESCREGELKEEWQGLLDAGRERLAENFLMTEPPFLPDRSKEHDAWGKIWKDAMNHSRQMGQDAQLFGLIYLVEEEDVFGRAAVDRLLEFASWDVNGATSTFNNNEPHMSVINLGPRAYDWSHQVMTEDERSKIRTALKDRGNQTLDRFRQYNYGVTGTDNHSGRLLGFLGECGIVLAGECDDVEEWFDFILPTTVAMYPWWGSRQGGWAQGVSYSSAYCYLFYHFIFSLREIANIDFYKKAWFRNHGEWRLLCVPPNAYLVPFGDGRTGGQNSVISSWGIQRHLGRIYGDKRFLHHADQILERSGGSIIESRGLYSPLSFLTPPTEGPDIDLPRASASLFEDVGWLAIRADLVDPDNDVRFMMRSSTFGSESHSHADQNSFVIEAFGEPLAVPSGLYNLYSSAHHHGWTRQTRAHNGVTFDGAGQIVRDAEAIGKFCGYYRDERLTYALGDASSAYGNRVKRSARSVLCLDDRLFVLVDEMVPSKEAMWTWHLHSVKPMHLDRENRNVMLQYDKAILEVSFCHQDELFMRTFEGWDYPPFGYESESEIPEEAARYHLDVTSMMPKRRDVMVTVMCPRRDGEDAAVVGRIWEDGVRGATIAWQGNTYRVEASVDLDQDRPLRALDVTLSGGAGEGQYHIAVEGAGDATGITIDAEAVAR
jgi:hypothetical protein